MAKNEIRIVTASEDVAAIIDRGANVKTQLDNLSYEDKGLKVKIGQLAQEQFADDESSIRLEGNTAVATVSESEKMTINVGAELFPALKDALDSGFLSDVVTQKKDLKVPPADIDRAAEVLQQSGFSASVVESLTVKPADVRKMEQSGVSSSEESNARKALKGCLEVTKSIRVAYRNK